MSVCSTGASIVNSTVGDISKLTRPTRQCQWWSEPKDRSRTPERPLLASLAPSKSGGAVPLHPNVQTSTCSAIAGASSTSIPRYRTVLSTLVCPRRSCSARRLPVRREINIAFVRLSACVPKRDGSRPMLATQRDTRRAYCRAVNPDPLLRRPLNRRSSGRLLGPAKRSSIAWRVCSVISNLTGRRVSLCRTVARPSA